MMMANCSGEKLGILFGNNRRMHRFFWNLYIQWTISLNFLNFREDYWATFRGSDFHDLWLKLCLSHHRWWQTCQVGEARVLPSRQSNLPGCSTMCLASWCRLRTWRPSWRGTWATALPRPGLRVSLGRARHSFEGHPCCYCNASL